jgi:hypothetical protein
VIRNFGRPHRQPRAISERLRWATRADLASAYTNHTPTRFL